MTIMTLLKKPKEIGSLIVSPLELGIYVSSKDVISLRFYLYESLTNFTIQPIQKITM
jgi:hypothetical protein